MHFRITSLQNPKIKSVLALEKPRERRRQQLFVIEGIREIQWAMEAGYSVGNLFFCDELIDVSELPPALAQDKLLVPVSKEVFDKLAVREGSGGVIAVATQKANRLADIRLKENPLIIVLESVEKPGNLGAVLRTADAAAVDAVIICDPQTDLYNPNVIRSSVGCLFTVPVSAVTSEEAIEWLRNNRISIYATTLQTSVPYDQLDFTTGCAIVMGTEATGLSELWRKAADANIIIPMLGKIDSLNVSNAAAVMTFEAVRQRRKAKS